MKSAVTAVALAAMTLGLGGCSNAMRGYLEHDTPEQTAAVRQDLSMPPDLKLPPPGSGADLSADAMAPAAKPGKTAALSQPQLAAASPTQGTIAPSAKPSATDSVYQQAGVSLYKPDGTRKTDYVLQEELRQAYIAKKKSQNPNYGTVMNVGNIFKDQ